MSDIFKKTPEEFARWMEEEDARLHAIGKQIERNQMHGTILSVLASVQWLVVWAIIGFIIGGLLGVCR